MRNAFWVWVLFSEMRITIYIYFYMTMGKTMENTLKLVRRVEEVKYRRQRQT